MKYQDLFSGKLKRLQNFIPAATIVILYVCDHQKQENVHGTKMADFNMRVHFDHSKFIQHYKYELFGEKVYKHEPRYHCHSSTGCIIVALYVSTRPSPSPYKIANAKLFLELKLNDVHFYSILQLQILCTGAKTVQLSIFTANNTWNQTPRVYLKTKNIQYSTKITQKSVHSINTRYMGLVSRKPDFVASKQQSGKPACTSAVWSSPLSGKNNS